MWFWSVSLSDQLSGQFLIFLGQPEKNCPVSETGHIFVHSVDFFCPVYILGSDQFPKKSGQKIQESGQKKMYGLQDGTIFLWPNKK